MSAIFWISVGIFCAFIAFCAACGDFTGRQD